LICFVDVLFDGLGEDKDWNREKTSPREGVAEILEWDKNIVEVSINIL